MKILNVLNPSLTDYKVSGAALQSINLGNSIMRTTDNQVDYVANSCIKNLVDKRSKVYDVPDLKKVGAIKKTLEYAVNVYKSGEYDIMHINIHQMSVLDSIMNVIPEYVNVVYTQHTSTILGRFSLGYRDSARYLSSNKYKNIRLVMPSNYMLNIWSEYTSLSTDEMNNVSVIYNGIKDYGFNEVGGSRYISCGRIDPNKRVKELAQFCDKYKIDIDIIGDIGVGTMKISDSLLNYYNEFKEICENSKYINWIPSLPNSEVLEMMGNSKGYICFSQMESFGLTIAESLCKGTPVFYIQPNSVLEELVDDGYISSTLNDMKRKSWNKKMEIIYQSFVDFSNNCVRKKARERYDSLGLSIDNSSSRYIDLFMKMLNI